MKKLDEILKNERIWGHEIMFQFHSAWVKLPECGKCSVIWSDCEDGMEHVSVSPKKQFRIKWFLNGWYHDRQPSESDKKRLVDYNIDQWRIYADFRQIYGINLNEADMHWWEFCGMLWNMPDETSSFLKVIAIRNKKVTSKMSKEEKEVIAKAKVIYALDSKPIEKEYDDDEKEKIDQYDKFAAKSKARKELEKKAVEEFRRCT